MRARYLNLLILSNALLLVIALASLLFAGLSEHFVHSQRSLEAAVNGATPTGRVYVHLIQRNAIWVLNQWLIFSGALLVGAALSLGFAFRACRATPRPGASPNSRQPPTLSHSPEIHAPDSPQAPYSGGFT